MSQKLAYIRVSTVEQNLERQLHSMSFDKVFEDKCSGKDSNRKGLKELIDYAREGDEIFVHDISRMARNTADLLKIVELFNSKGVTLRFVKESLAFSGESNPMNDLMLTLLGAIYQFERSMILERQREGIEIAKKKGKFKGKQPNKELYLKIQKLFDKGMTKRSIAIELGCSRPTVYRALCSATSQL
ncbi:resolvase [Shewanella sp. UCD-FRSSP16_17]|uniref:recombinase family protein n=1 Tax=Shewanella sp. UCD-FRSSP16_17 TaxID=1853256 RepID=UPI0007EEE1E4|nr:recombinase family protein [Shewanella sp. UCD-FRSSP16_17]OBT04763.1 resolvase [Shewanella sp. UCD-FRSSP16_17]